MKTMNRNAAIAISFCAFSMCGILSAATPSFSLAWSEYPSWSTFGVAHELGLINGKKGEMGSMEKKWNVDIELKEAEYDPCIMMYGAGKCDAVCITNMDVLNPALSVPSVSILPTSTSYGADACIVADSIRNVKDLRGKEVYGLAKTVSEYCFVRNLELLGENENDYKFTNMDPGAAATAMQQKQAGFNAIVVWNPMLLETLNKRKDSKVLFDSSKIPGEIIDMVVMSQKSLEQPGSANFAKAVIETFYEICKKMENPETRDATLLALGEKFSHLDVKSMRKVVEQTKFYRTPQMALDLFSGGRSFPGDEVKDQPKIDEIMRKVVEFCIKHEIAPKDPGVGYGAKADAPKAGLRLDPSFIKELK